MVRRGSTVRVRQRALKRPANGLFCCLSSGRPSLDRPSTCPQDLSRTLTASRILGLNKRIWHHGVPPLAGGARSSWPPKSTAARAAHDDAGAPVKKRSVEQTDGGIEGRAS